MNLRTYLKTSRLINSNVEFMSKLLDYKEVLYHDIELKNEYEVYYDRFKKYD